MPIVACEGRELPLAEGETVLDVLVRAGVPVSSSCRAGACQSCLVQATRGTPPPDAQRGLKESLRMQGYFLACQAKPSADLDVSLEGARALAVDARVDRVEHLTRDVLQVRLQLEGPLELRPGQFLTLVRGDGVARSYSIANTPHTREGHVDLHVRIYASGLMSSWLAGPSAVGERVQVRGPLGDCFYVPGHPHERLLLIGTGTGLAPLWAVLHEALAKSHEGPIELWHGAPSAAGLYLTHELRALEERHAHFRYRPCVLEGAAESGLTVGNLGELAFASVTSLADSRVYLCGDPGLVQRLKKKAFLGGAPLRSIHADAFLPSA